MWEKHIGPVTRKLCLRMGDGLFTAYNEESNWRKAHNILMPAFTKTAMVVNRAPQLLLCVNSSSSGIPIDPGSTSKLKLNGSPSKSSPVPYWTTPVLQQTQ